MAEVSVDIAIQYLKDMGIFTKNYDYEGRITDIGEVIVVARGVVTGMVKKNIEIRKDDKVFDRVGSSKGGVIQGNGTELHVKTPFSQYVKDYGTASAPNM